MHSRNLKRLFLDLKHYTFWLLGSLLFAVIGVSLGILATSLTGDIIDAITVGATSSNIDFSRISSIIFYLILAGLGVFLFSVISELLLVQVTNLYTFKLRQQIFTKINRLPVLYFNQNKTGDILTRMSEDSSRIGETLIYSVARIVRSFIYLVGATFAMAQISWLLFFISLVALVFSFVFAIFLLKKTKPLSVATMSLSDQVTGYIEETYSNQSLIQANSRESSRLSRIHDLIYAQKQVDLKKIFLSELIRPVQKVANYSGIIGICFVGGNLIIKKAMTIGSLQVFLRHYNTINHYAFEIINALPDLQDINTSIARVFDFIDEPEDTLMTNLVSPVARPSGAVEFRNVTFSYHGKPVIKDFSLRVAPGEKVAIVGPTGSGKTTLISLLMRFYDIDSGDILIDGHSIAEFSKPAIRKMFGMVLQDAWLFSGSIRDNLSYGQPSLPLSKLKKIAIAAHIDKIINRLPEGYKTEIAEDSDSLSAGERQLFTIARAMAADPAMLILDEATSNIDTRTERDIQDAMEKLMRRRTSFVIAHRLSTIIDADKIVVLKDGKIQELGTHQQLLALNGVYSELYKSQFSQS